MSAVLASLSRRGFLQRSAGGLGSLALAQLFVERFRERQNKQVKGLSPAAADRLLAYAWPGNVRELANSIERAVALARLRTIHALTVSPGATVTSAGAGAPSGPWVSSAISTSCAGLNSSGKPGNATSILRAGSCTGTSIAAKLEYG